MEKTIIIYRNTFQAVLLYLISYLLAGALIWHVFIDLENWKPVGISEEILKQL